MKVASLLLFPELPKVCSWGWATGSNYVRRTRLSTVGDRAFPVAAARLWNSLPFLVTTATTFLSIFCCDLKSRLFSLSYPTFWLLSYLYSARWVTQHFGDYNLFHIGGMITWQSWCNVLIVEILSGFRQRGHQRQVGQVGVGDQSP